MRNEYDDAGKIIASPDDEQQAATKAKHKSKRAQMAGWEGTMRVLGNPTIKSKSTATLERCGKVIDGDWRISSVKHEISDSGYTCSLKLIRPDESVAGDNTVASSDATDDVSGDDTDNSSAGGNSAVAETRKDDATIVNIS